MAKIRKKITLTEIWTFLLDKLQNISKNIATIGVIIGALIGAGNWIINGINTLLDEKIEAVNASISEQELSLVRLELMSLINHDPENKAGIEKLAKKYFVELGGDQYMTGVYSKWAAEHNGTTTFVNH